MIIQRHTSEGIEEINTDDYTEQELEEMGLLKTLRSSVAYRRSQAYALIDASSLNEERKVLVKNIVDLALNVQSE